MSARIDPTTLPGRPCSLAAALEIIGDRWSLLVVREVSFGNGRFSQIARNTGAPRDRLAARLKTLVDAGVLARHAYQETPLREEYRLTEAGRDLAAVTGALLAWGDKWAVTAPPIRLVHHHDHELTPKTYCTTCAGIVHREDVSRESLVDGWDIQGPLV
jgi:DNA-binding HxlR family transcriptional regulator